jgi:D-glycero-D-manno-heptose 1,7-bisphosphate phosphatase
MGSGGTPARQCHRGAKDSGHAALANFQVNRSGGTPARPTGLGVKPCAVLFDRDETIVVDVPFNGDPDLVKPAPNARTLLDRLRAAGLPLAVVSNQSGIARGFITPQAVDAVNRRIDQLLGPFAGFFTCPHAPEDACDCRKPKPKLILDAARALGVDPACCVVVGDRASDVEAARNAGAIPIKVAGPHELEKAVERILQLATPS